MPLEIDVAQIQALAPDAAAAAAARKLGRPGPWQHLGYNDAALWGECQGSARYQTRIARVDLAAKCSCPSRKFPCKHALGLLFLAADEPAAFPAGEPPEWVASWLEQRSAAQEKKRARAQAAADTPAPVDEAAQARRAAKRHDNVLAGLDQLDAWMNDLIRQGLARVQGEPASLWDTQARRLIDAQAPGLAARIRRIGELVGAGAAWAERVLAELGATALLTHAYRRLDQLDAALAADVRRLIGYTLEHAEVLAQGERVEDDWRVLGEVTEEEERLRMQRVWLAGSHSGRIAMILQFAAGAARFPEALLVGTQLPAQLVFWPSACPQRALIAERKGQAAPMTATPQGPRMAQCLDRFAQQLGRVPWLERDLFILDAVVPVSGAVEPATPASAPDALPDTTVTLVDPTDVASALPLQGSNHDVLLALSGGHPITVAGEWDGYVLRPLVAWSRNRMVLLERRSL